MSFPRDRDGMIAAGYTFSNHGVCKACKQEIEWWKTPRQKPIPMDLMQKPDSQAVSHFATCNDAPLFRK